MKLCWKESVIIDPNRIAILSFSYRIGQKKQYPFSFIRIIPQKPRRTDLFSFNCRRIRPDVLLFLRILKDNFKVILVKLEVPGGVTMLYHLLIGSSVVSLSVVKHWNKLIESTVASKP